MQSLPAWAEDLARNLLEDTLPRRWAHVQGVAARARSLAPAFAADKELLEAAAWLHDIGYLPELAEDRAARPRRRPLPPRRPARAPRCCAA